MRYVAQHGPAPGEALLSRFSGYERPAARAALRRLAAAGRVRAVTNPRFVYWEATPCP